ncbi:hypothetical protein B0T19DRAFT_419440 [Cercophora scortea]|uniref:Uncharacterized protein n=1 Tax=Cercophora scortea TaxID=314031 RepID=A0AAE0IZT6_9PEZI|nr:hypothetical protein B0T19DRAFT_419440 [Cercophora scortea]
MGISLGFGAVASVYLGGWTFLCVVAERGGGRGECRYGWMRGMDFLSLSRRLRLSMRENFFLALQHSGCLTRCRGTRAPPAR